MTKTLFVYVVIVLFVCLSYHKMYAVKLIFVCLWEIFQEVLGWRGMGRGWGHGVNLKRERRHTSYGMSIYF